MEIGRVSLGILEPRCGNHWSKGMLRLTFLKAILYLILVEYVVRTVCSLNPFKCPVKSHLSFADVIRSSPYSPH